MEEEVVVVEVEVEEEDITQSLEVHARLAVGGGGWACGWMGVPESTR